MIQCTSTCLRVFTVFLGSNVSLISHKVMPHLQRACRSAGAAVACFEYQGTASLQANNLSIRDSDANFDKQQHQIANTLMLSSQFLFFKVLPTFGDFQVNTKLKILQQLLAATIFVVHKEFEVEYKNRWKFFQGQMSYHIYL